MKSGAPASALALVLALASRAPAAEWYQAAGALLPAVPAAAGKAVAPSPCGDFASVRGAAGVSSDPHFERVFDNALRDLPRLASCEPDGTVWVKTGDIPAEWLRDSSAQVRPLLFFARQDPGVARFLKAVIERQGHELSDDPYANAFKRDGSVWERKFELDSLAYPVELAWTYWKVTGDASVLTPGVRRGLAAALSTMEAETGHDASRSGYRHPQLKNAPFANTGMIWSGFRPSDDACRYPFLIPSEMMAVVALGELSELERAAGDDDAASRADALRRRVHDGIQRYGVVDAPGYGKVYAYEVDGLGHYALMDDANLPSLLSAPYLGYGRADDPVYQNTRRMLLSKDNPYFYHGKQGLGEGSPHTPKGYVWPLALLAQALTATDQAEKSRVEQELLASDPGDGRLHESYDPNDPARYTRKDFGWPNALFAEYALTARGGRAPLPSGSTDDLTFAR